MTTIQLLTGDCLELLKTLPDQSVQCCVTSPPYYGLRDYGTAKWEGGDSACDHKPGSKKRVGKTGLKGGTGTSGHQQEDYRTMCAKCGAVRVDSQIGLEQSPEEYVAKLVAVFREVKRVLKDDGTLWLNLGDSYTPQSTHKAQPGKRGGMNQRGRDVKDTVNIQNWGKPKDLIGIPWMVAFALRADGWYLRSDIIWHKPNPMPESVTDRPTKSQGMLEIAALPVRPDKRYRRNSNLLKRQEQTKRMALFMIRDALDGLWFLNVLSPGYAPLMPFALVDGNTTVSQMWNESSNMRRLAAPQDSDFIIDMETLEKKPKREE